MKKKDQPMDKSAVLVVFLLFIFHMWDVEPVNAKPISRVVKTLIPNSNISFFIMRDQKMLFSINITQGSWREIHDTVNVISIISPKNYNSLSVILITMVKTTAVMTLASTIKQYHKLFRLENILSWRICISVNSSIYLSIYLYIYLMYINCSID